MSEFGAPYLPAPGRGRTYFFIHYRKYEKVRFLSSFQVMKSDIAVTQQFVEAAALAAATFCENAEAAVQTFARVAPHASHHPQVGQVDGQLQALAELARQAMALSMNLYHAVEDVDKLFS
ncbi:hypothetical protein SAMN04489729_5511 [Amycolatopsis lurida]|uniref:PE domain-containing protein n=1 Tax=Amycolatopsis lurida NRRL 2430 TaxID=1460371 RepID=A0A2P2FVM1_AMYLU|nr:hypothetical protein [Amycolatopsis lurida]KFU80770.1 hypothetical protein BB31_12525 [Amycolatopsis lurida NRRL 2430]SED85759.1 hypothetical protein SAMN04489729_5511 [Amycolatopsis lurida]